MATEIMKIIRIVYILGLFDYSLALTTGGALLTRLFLTGPLIITGLIGFILIRKDEKHNV